MNRHLGFFTRWSSLSHRLQGLYLRIIIIVVVLLLLGKLLKQSCCTAKISQILNPMTSIIFNHIQQFKNSSITKRVLKGSCERRHIKMDSLVPKKEVLKSQCNVTVTDAYNTNDIVYSIHMYILYSLQCPSPGDSSFCMHWNAIATALWKLLTATNPHTPTHLAAGPLPQWPHVHEWGVGWNPRVSQIQEGLIRDPRFCYSNTCYFDDLRSFSTCLKVGEITYHPYLTPPGGLGVKSPINQPISLWDIAVTWWAGWNSKWSIRRMWVIYLYGDKSVIRPNSSCNQPLWIAIWKSIQKI